MREQACRDDRLPDIQTQAKPREAPDANVLILGGDPEIRLVLPLIRGALQFSDQDEAELERRVCALGPAALDLLQAHCAAISATLTDLAQLSGFLHRARTRLLRLAAQDLARRIDVAHAGPHDGE